MPVLTGGPVAPAPVAATYPALLDDLHEAVTPGRLVASAAGFVLASDRALPPAHDTGLARFGAAWTRAGDGTEGPAGINTGATAAAARERFANGLITLHCGLLRDVLSYVMRWLDGRTADGSTLLSRQLIQGACADVAVEIAECEAMCAGLEDTGPDSHTPELRRLIARRLTAAGRTLLDLLGASGFRSDGPGGALFLAELAANVYLHPGTENQDARVDHL